MRKSKNIILHGLFIVLLAGCSKNYIPTGDEVILFQVDYTNTHTGNQHYGYYIDNKGNVFTYSNPTVWNSPDSLFVFSNTGIMENLSYCIKSEIRIPPEELNKFAGYIKNIASTKVTARKMVGTGKGTLKYICFQRSETSDQYKGFIIREEGNYTCANLNYFSKRTITWLSDINSRLTDK